MPPDPIDFDGGVQDPKYAQALRDFNQPLIAAEVDKRVSALPVASQTQGAPSNPDLERRQRQHYERAQEMKAKDFEETEDKAIAILGNEVVNHLIQSSEKSHIVLYYLGKNPDIAEDIKSLIDTDPVKATLQLGRLEAELSVKPKADLEPTPDPDTELQGGTPSAGQNNKFQKKLNRLRDKAAEGGGGGNKAMLAISNLKREAKEAGVTIE